MKLDKKFLFSLVLTVVTVLLLFDTKLGVINILDSSSVYPSLIFAVFNSFILFKFFYYFNAFKKRNLKIALVAAIIFSVFYVFGHQLDLLDNFTVDIWLVVSVITIGIMYFALIANLLESTTKIKEFDFEYHLTFFDKLLSKYIYIWAFVFVLTIPYIIALNPGSLSFDSYNVLLQATGNFELSSGHPVFYTLLIKGIYSITEFLGLSKYYTVLIYSIIQSLVMSSIYAYAVYTLKKLGCKLYYIIAALIFYSLFPVFPVHSITMWKDVLFSGMILLYTIYLYKAKTEKDFFSSYKNLLSLAAVTLGVLLFRTNGILVVVMSLPLILYIFKKQLIKVLLASLIPIGLYILFITIGFNALDVQDFRKNEAFTIPYQHLARIYKYEENLSAEDEEFMENVFIEDKFIYHPRISDYARFRSADVEYFENNTDEFFDNWFRLVQKYPVTLVKSFLNTNFAYWYPGFTRWSVHPIIDNIDYISVEPSLSAIERKINDDIGKGFVYFTMENTISKRITGVGFVFTVFAVLFLIKLSQKNKNATILFVPSFMLWLGVIFGSPICGDFRYIFGMFASLPFIMGVVLFSCEDTIAQ